MVIYDEIDRGAIVREMDDARASLRRLLSMADTDTLARRSDGTRWTNEQLLFHMVFVYMVVRALLVLVRIFGRLPPRVSRGFAAVLDFMTAPLHVVNYWGSRMAALTFNHRRMAAHFDHVVGSPQLHLLRETPESLVLTMRYPTRWDPFLESSMSEKPTALFVWFTTPAAPKWPPATSRSSPRAGSRSAPQDPCPVARSTQSPSRPWPKTASTSPPKPRRF